MTFALSGLDIALWDIAAKAAGKPLHALLGGTKRDRVPAYASLLRYGDPALVARNTAEPSPAAIAGSSCTRSTSPASGRARAAPPEVPLMLDINCAWDTVEQGIAFCRAVHG